jgi:hypothetical protein
MKLKHFFIPIIFLGNTCQRLYPLFLCLIFAQILRGQESENTLQTQPKFMLKVNPSAAINILEPTIAFGVEHILVKNHYLEHEIGYIYTNPIGLSKETRGFRLRLGYRFMVKNNMYVGIQSHYRKLYGDGQNYAWRKDNSFQQNIKYSNNFYSYGFTLLGGQRFFWTKKSRLFTDIQLGLGMSWRPFKIENYPNNFEYPRSYWINDADQIISEGTTIRNGTNKAYLNVLIALKIGYVIF